MKFLISVVIVLEAFSSHAEEKTPEYKNWKTFRSDYGYEFKYPDCWAVKGDGPDEPEMATPISKNMFITETEICKRPKMDVDVPNGIGISGGWDHLKSRDDALKRLARSEKNSDITVKRDEWKIYKRLKQDGTNEAFIYVENNHKIGYTYIRWQMDFYCPTEVISITGPSIKDPDENLLKKFKAGDLALPEPEKTIYESIRCVKPKKSPMNKVKK